MRRLLWPSVPSNHFEDRRHSGSHREWSDGAGDAVGGVGERDRVLVLHAVERPVVGEILDCPGGGIGLDGAADVSGGSIFRARI